MPRIMAPTLAENRDQRHASLLAAGHELVRTGGPRALTLAAVATRAGLSRPAAYEYFGSTADLLAAVLLDEMRRWSGDVVDHLATESTPETKITRYIEVSLRLIADGQHEIVAMLSETSLPPAVRQQINELHSTLAAPLTQAVAALGISDTDQAVRLIQGVVEAAARRLVPGRDPSSEVRAATAFVLAGLRALATD